jgi:hypothetical protein
LKKGVVYGAKEMTQLSKGSVSGVALDFAGVVWEATESADTRCWGLLPDKIQVLRIELPIGMHQLQLAAVDAAGQTGDASIAETIEIADGRNTYVLGTFPDLRPIGQLLVSQDVPP